MKKVFVIIWISMLTLALGLTACQPAGNTNKVDTGSNNIKVLAAESFLTDIAQNIAGDRFQVDTLIPRGMDPHAFEPVPKDIVKISETDILIVNGGGMESWLDNIIQNAGGEHLVIEASHGLQFRTHDENEDADHDSDHEGEEEHGSDHETEAEHSSVTETEIHGHNHENDPHFWLNPINVIQYVENIRDGYIKVDPAGKETYTQNAANYIAKLNELDQSILQQISIIPPERRIIVTNHESFGYFADQYQFKIVGTIIPSVSTGASPSAQQLSQLIDQIKATGAPAIFLETGSNGQLANQIAAETGVKVVTDLNTHSTTETDGDASTYIGMMQSNVKKFVNALK